MEIENLGKAAGAAPSPPPRQASLRPLLRARIRRPFADAGGPGKLDPFAVLKPTLSRRISSTSACSSATGALRSCISRAAARRTGERAPFAAAPSGPARHCRRPRLAPPQRVLPPLEGRGWLCVRAAQRVPLRRPPAGASALPPSRASTRTSTSRRSSRRSRRRAPARRGAPRADRRADRRTSPSSPPAGTRQAHCCNGTIVEDAEMGQVLQFQGDQRDAVVNFLRRTRSRTSAPAGHTAPSPPTPTSSARRASVPAPGGPGGIRLADAALRSARPTRAPQRAVLRPATQLRPRRPNPSGARRPPTERAPPPHPLRAQEQDQEARPRLRRRAARARARRRAGGPPPRPPRAQRRARPPPAVLRAAPTSRRGFLTPAPRERRSSSPWFCDGPPPPSPVAPRSLMTQ